ncbi:MAG: restriction endonuclease subunit S [Spiroplasma sp.]|nr:restriction endonuclease subunit S [Spiroplasma sp.]
MAIYKLGDICNYVEGYVNPEIANEDYFDSTGTPWLKVADLIHGSNIYSTKTYLSTLGKSLAKHENQLFKKDSIVWSKSGSIGVTSILGIDAMANRGILNIKPNTKYIKNKYLFYFLCKNKTIFSNKGFGAVLKHFYGPNLMNEKINLPLLKKQQSIIDIIEPIEKLFLKYSNCVRINTFENVQSDIKNLIDIIEPIEKLENNIYRQINKINFLIKNIKITKQKIKLSDILEPIKNPPKRLEQASAKVLMKNTTLISSLEKKGTYNTNSFFCPKETFLFCSIRTYLQKYCILPIDADVNGTLYQFKIKRNFTSLLNALQNKEFWQKTNLLSTGTKMPKISQKDFLNIKINKTTFEIKNLTKLLVIQNKVLIKLDKLKENLIYLLIK